MDMEVAVEHQTGFTLDLFKTVLEKGVGSNQSNLVMSPISIATALAMVCAGAKGDTLAELTSVLKLPEGDALHEFTSHIMTTVLKEGTGAGGPILSLANGLWVDKSMTLKSKFEEALKGCYGAEVKTADFGHKIEEERIAINSWVLDETKGKIQDLLPSDCLDESTRMLLANALYFKGPWAKPFDADQTRNADFHLLNGETVSVPFLASKEKQFIENFDTHKVLKLPYAQGEAHRSYSMYIVLPHEKAGLPEVEKNLDAKTLVEHCNWITKEAVKKFLLPKFKVSTGLKVPDALRSLGLKTPFSPGLANFSDMVEGPGGNMLVLREIVHKAFVEVNEEGTEAAAATGVEAVKFCIRPPEEFIADHPFLFILKEDVTGVILFIGRITNPSLSE